MQAKPRDVQGDLYSVQLEFLFKETHPLVRLSKVIDWPEFDKAFGQLYSEGQGRPAKPTRLMVGLHYLKHAFDLSDEEVVSQWVENPYWQLFCGEEYFRHEFPIDPSLMTKWRNRVKECRLGEVAGVHHCSGLEDEGVEAYQPSTIERGHNGSGEGDKFSYGREVVSSDAPPVGRTSEAGRN